MEILTGRGLKSSCSCGMYCFCFSRKMFFGDSRVFFVVFLRRLWGGFSDFDCLGGGLEIEDLSKVTLAILNGTAE